MSENTPDTILGGSAIDTDDNEPSMEDILASIRQIIAEDKVDDALDVTDDEVVFDVNADLPVESLVQEKSEPVSKLSEADAPCELIREVKITNPVETAESKQQQDEEESILDLISFVDDNTDDAQEQGLDEAQGNVTGTKSIDVGLHESLALSVEPSVASREGLNEDINKNNADEKSSIFENLLPDSSADAIGGAFDDEFSDLTTLPPVTPADTGEVKGESSMALEDELSAILPAVELPDTAENNAENFAPLVDLVKPSDKPQLDSDDVGDISIFFEDLDNDTDQMQDVATATATNAENGSFEELSVEQDMAEENSEEVLRATPDEDIKLVKSLLEDLMNDPEVETSDDTAPTQEEHVQEAAVQENVASGFLAADEIGDLGGSFFDDAVVITDNASEPNIKTNTFVKEKGVTEASILDEILETVVKDEVAVHKEMSALLPQEASAPEKADAPLEIPEETLEVEKVVATPSAEPEPELANDTFIDFSAENDEGIPENQEEAKSLLDVVTASEPVAVSESDVVIENDDDVVVLPSVDITSKMALVAKTGAAIVATGAAAIAVAQSEETEMQDEQAIEVLVTQERVQETTPPHTKNELKELKNMAQPAKTENILDAVEHQAGVDAFASLSAVVKEKAIEETKGPAIGDLVQDALKPMLKEWLDANLKKIVEKAVTAEVKRISSGK